MVGNKEVMVNAVQEISLNIVDLRKAVTISAKGHPICVRVGGIISVKLSVNRKRPLFEVAGDCSQVFVRANHRGDKNGNASVFASLWTTWIGIFPFVQGISQGSSSLRTIYQKEAHNERCAAQLGAFDNSSDKVVCFFVLRRYWWGRIESEGVLSLELRTRQRKQSVSAGNERGDQSGSEVCKHRSQQGVELL